MSEPSPQSSSSENNSSCGSDAQNPAGWICDVLWHVTRKIQSVASPDEVLSLIAEAIAEAGLYVRAVLTLHDDQGKIIAIGHHGIPDDIIAAARNGPRLSLEKRQAIFAAAVKVSESYFLPAEANVEFADEGRHVAVQPGGGNTGSWQSDDQLFVPIFNLSRDTVGYASVDTPVDGSRPDEATVRRLELFVHLAAEALERVSTKEKLVDTEERFQDLLANTEEVIYRVDFSRGKVEYVNPAIERLTGWTVEEMTSTPLDELVNELIHPDDIPLFYGNLQADSGPRDGRQKNRQYRVLHRDGSVRWVMVERVVTYDANRRPIAVEGTMHDVTEQKLAADALLESEEKFRTLSYNIPGMIYRGNPDWSTDFISNTEAICGYPPEEFLGEKRSWIDLVHPEDRDSVLNAAKELESIQKSIVQQYRIFTREKAVRWVEDHKTSRFDEQGNFLGIDGVLFDVTDRVLASEALRRSELRFRELADLLPQTVFELDLEANIVYTNRAGLEAFGYTQADVDAGVSAFDLFVEGDQRRLRENFQKIITSGESSDHEYTAIRSDGTQFPVLISSTSIIRDGRPVGARGLVIDLTERHEAAAQLRESEETARALLNAATESMILLDREGTILTLNETAAGRMGRSVDELVGKKIQEQLNDLYPPLAAKSRLENVEKALHSGKVLRCEESRGGDIYDAIYYPILDSDGQVVRLAIFALDITERVLGEEALEEAEERYRSLQSNLPVGVFRSTPEGEVIYMNPAMVQMYGYDSLEEMVRQPVTDLYCDPRDRITMLSLLSTHGSVENYVCKMRCKDGSTRWVSCSMQATKDDLGNIDYIDGIDIDITQQKIAEESVKQSERRYQELFDSLQEGIGIVDEHEVIEFCNPAFAKIFGIDDPESMMGTSLFSYVPEDQHALILAETAKSRKNEKLQYELDIVTPAGAHKNILASISPRFADNGDYLGAFSSVLDITELKTTEDELRESESRFRLLAEQNLLGILIMQDDRLQYANQAAAAIIGYSIDELLALSPRQVFVDLVHPDDREFVGGQARKKQDGEQADIITHYSYRIVPGGGKQKWIDQYSKTVEYRGRPANLITITDITERRLAEEELRKFKTISDRASYGMAIVDLDGNIQYLNSEFAGMHQYTPEELIGENLTVFHAPEQLGFVYALNTRLERDGFYVAEEVWHVRKNGEVFPTLMSATIITDDKGVPQFLSATAIEISELVQARKALEDREEQFRTFAENIAGVVFTYDEYPDGHRVPLYIGPGIEKIAGLATAKRIRNNLDDYFSLILAEDLQALQAASDAARASGELLDHEYRLRTDDGKTHWVRTIAKIVKQDGEIIRWQGQVLDITSQKEAELALRENEARYHNLFENSPAGIFRMNIDATAFLTVNPAGAAMVGRTIDEFLATPPDELWIDPTHRERLRKRLLREGSIADKEIALKLPDGTERIFLHSLKLYPEFGYVEGTAIDITERKQAETLLHESEERFRTIATAIPIPLAITGLQDGEILFANDQLCSTYGCSSEEVLKLNAKDLYHDVGNRQKFIEMLERGEPIRNHEILGKRSDGSSFWCLLSLDKVTFAGQPALLGALMDITERKKALDQLMESEQTARALLNSTPDSAFLLKTDGTILALNERGAAQLGGSIEELSGMNVFDFFPPEVAKSRRAYRDTIIETRQPIAFRDESGGRKFVSNIYPLFDADGVIDRFAVAVRDVTEREEMLEQLRRQGRDLDRANTELSELVQKLEVENLRASELAAQFQTKNRELELLVSTLSHDLKTPLISIRELIKKFMRLQEAVLDDKTRPLGERISANADIMLRLVEGLLDYSKIGDYLKRIDEIDLRPLLEDLWEQVDDRFAHRRAVFHCPGQSQTCRTTRIGLERVLLNLLSNAVAHVPPDRRPEVEVDWQVSPEFLTIAVADNGPGIPESKREDIFKLFHRAAGRRVEGAGIGLAVVKKIVDTLKGSVTVSAGDKGGAVFKVTLPIPESPSGQAQV